jgi:uncharacterized protein YkwD
MRIASAVGAAAVVAGLGATPGALAAGGCTALNSWGKATPNFERQVLVLVNQHRTAMGLRPLQRSASLTRAARWKSKHMARFRYFEHSDPSGRSPFQRIADCGFKRRLATGENIAAGQRTPQSVFRSWLESPGHRRNIESPAFRYIGIGAVHRGSSVYGWYWTQDFGR